MPAAIFTIVSTVSTINFIIVWLLIMWAHFKYRRSKDNVKISFKMPGFPLTSLLTIVFYLFILIIFAFIDSTRLPLLLSFIFVVLLWLIYPLVHSSKNN